MFHVRSVFRIFIKGHQILTFFKRSFFSGRVTLKQIEKQKKTALREPGGLLPQKVLENLHTVMAISVLLNNL